MVSDIMKRGIRRGTTGKNYGEQLELIRACGMAITKLSKLIGAKNHQAILKHRLPSYDITPTPSAKAMEVLDDDYYAFPMAHEVEDTIDDLIYVIRMNREKMQSLPKTTFGEGRTSLLGVVYDGVTVKTKSVEKLWPMPETIAKVMKGSLLDIATKTYRRGNKFKFGFHFGAEESVLVTSGYNTESIAVHVRAGRLARLFCDKQVPDIVKRVAESDDVLLIGQHDAMTVLEYKGMTNIHLRQVTYFDAKDVNNLGVELKYGWVAVKQYGDDKQVVTGIAPDPDNAVKKLRHRVRHLMNKADS